MQTLFVPALKVLAPACRLALVQLGLGEIATLAFYLSLCWRLNRAREYPANLTLPAPQGAGEHGPLGYES
jgi:hypothetical protein